MRNTYILITKDKDLPVEYIKVQKRFNSNGQECGSDISLVSDIYQATVFTSKVAANNVLEGLRSVCKIEKI